MFFLKNLIKHIGRLKTIYLVLIVFALSIIVFSSTFFVFYTRNDNELLYSDLSDEDRIAVSNKLNEFGISYKIDHDKKGIAVNIKDVSRTRAVLAKHGLPSGCNIMGYELYDLDVPLGSTSEVQHVKFVRALQGELVRTIRSFEKIINARVHVSLPRKEIFSQEKQLTTASVMLYVAHGEKLDKSTINGIVHLISCAVPSLLKKDIVIVDSNGEPLYINGEDSSLNPNMLNSVNKQIDQILYYENHIKNNLEVLIGRVVGLDNVAVKVHLDMNFDSVTTASETYDPEKTATKEEHIKDKKELSRGSSATEVDTSVENNVTDSEEASEGEEDNFSESTETEKNLYYSVSKIVQNKIHQIGTIRRISVAVLLNEKDSDISQSDKETREQKIIDVVKASVGYNDDREDNVVVHTMHFAKNSPLDDVVEISKFTWMNKYFYDLIKIFLITFVSLFCFVYIVRSIAKAYLQKYQFNLIREEGDSSVSLGTSSSLESENNLGVNQDDEVKLKKQLEVINQHNFVLFAPPIHLCTDNAAMIAYTALQYFKQKKYSKLNVAPQAKWGLDTLGDKER